MPVHMRALNATWDIDIAPDNRKVPLRATPSGTHLTAMSKAQIQELKAILGVFARRLRSDRLDDPMRILAYRAQVIVDEAQRSAAFHQVQKAG